MKKAIGILAGLMIVGLSLPALADRGQGRGGHRAGPAHANQHPQHRNEHARNHAGNNQRQHPQHHPDRDNNPPGPKGGPGTNWENPPGPAGGPGASPDRRLPPIATRDPGVNARQHNQQHRVAEGVRSGELTKEETKQLAVEQRAIRQEERAYKSDGVLTPAERKDLHQDLNEASKHIYEEKHDAEKRSGAGVPPPGNPAIRDPGVNARQHNQQHRVVQGIRSGELTKDETKQLAAEQRAIRQEERAYKSDGVLTKEERKDLHQDLNEASKHIYEEKHDVETRR